MARTFAVLALAALCSGCASAIKAQVEMVDTLRIRDAVTTYEAARSGAPLDRCVKAKLVAIAYEDARDPGSASAWRAREREDCQAAVMVLGVETSAQRVIHPGR